MNCPHCSAEVSSSAKFCPECGSPLSLTTPAFRADANHAALLQNYIPPELAKRILAAGKQIESERRLITVLFADVSGFTAMSEKLDAEEVSLVLNDCFKGLISIVYKYEGVIDKFIGDEIMAIFGAPLTHENDPERALRCSMEMMEYMERFNQLTPIALPEPLGLHISMNTGMVVAGNVGSDLRMNYSVIGDTVNLASRLKHIAQRGEIVVSEDTYRIVSSFITAEEPQQVEVKGKSEPVKVYKVLSLKGGIEPGTRVTQKSPIIGRELEIGQLKMAIQQVLQKKEQRLFIRGEAGVGKTRLKLELIQHAKSSGITAYEGKCSSFEINTPYYLWTTLLKDILQLKPDTGESETRKRLRDMLQILSIEKHEPYLATLLSLRYEEILLEEDAERKKRIFESLKEFIRALAKRKSSLFLLEDVHWIDRFSQDMLMYLLAEKELAPAMFVTLFRDEYVHSKELIEKGGILIDLNRLTKSDAQRLMCARLQAEEVPTNLYELVYKRSEGNPFFIEELVKTLLDKKVVAVKKQKLEILNTDFESILPETVQGVIMARIDRLEEKLKEVLYGASVIGREFDKSLLEEILKKKEAVDPSLHELLSLELILEKEEAKELAYFFKHYLIQEVAYNTILQKKRKELHGLIARTIEHLYADRLKEFYELLAFHYEKAEEWEKAADYLGRAGRKVGEMFSREETSNFSQRRDTALEKVYQSKSASRLGLQILAGVVALIAGAQILGLASEIYVGLVLIWRIGSYTFRYLDFELFFGLLRDSGIVNIAIMIVGSTYISLLFVFYGVIPLLRRAPKVYDITPESVEVVFRKKRFVLPFSQIHEILLSNPQQRKKRRWRHRILDPFHRIRDYSEISFFTLLRKMSLRIPAFSFSFSSKRGEIQILKKHGLSLSQVVFPFLFVDRLSRAIVLCPADPKEFYEELKTAYDKWKMRSAGVVASDDKNKSWGRNIINFRKRKTAFAFVAGAVILLVVGYSIHFAYHPGIEPTGLTPIAHFNVDSLRQNAALHPLDHRAWQQLGEALLHKVYVSYFPGEYLDYYSLSQQRLLDEAVSAFSEASVLDTTDAHSFALLGRALFYKANLGYFGDTSAYALSLQYLQHAITIQPHNPEPYVDLVIELTIQESNSDQLLTARKYMETALTLGSHSGRAQFALACLLQAEGRYSEAMPVLEKALDLGMEDEICYLELPFIYDECSQPEEFEGGPKIAGNIFSKAGAIRDIVNEKVKGSFSFASVVFGDFRKAAELRLENPTFYWTLAAIYRHFGNEEHAGQFCRQAFMRDPEMAFYTGYFYYFIRLANERDPQRRGYWPKLSYEPITKFITAAADSSPGNYWVLTCLGDIQCDFLNGFDADSSRLDRGIQAYLRAIRTNSRYADAFLRLSCAYLKEKDSVKASHYLDTALTKEIRDLVSLGFMNSYLMSNDQDMALKLNKHLLASEIVDPLIPLPNLAEIYGYKLHDYPRALSLCKEILQRNQRPLMSQQRTVNCACDLYVRTGQYDQAIDLTTKLISEFRAQLLKRIGRIWSVSLHEWIEWSLTDIGLCYALKGDDQRAILTFRQALKEDPKYLVVEGSFKSKLIYYHHEEQLDRIFALYRTAVKEQMRQQNAEGKVPQGN